MRHHLLPLFASFALFATIAIRADLITNINALGAADGSIIGGVGIEDTATSVMTYPDGFALYDKKGGQVFTNQLPPGIEPHTHLVGFDGRVAVFQTRGVNTQVMVFAVGKEGFTACPLSMPGVLLERNLYLEPSEIVMGVSSGGSSTDKATTFTFAAFDRKMKKILWTQTVKDPWFWLGKDVLAWFDSGISKMVFAKKGATVFSQPVSLAKIPLIRPQFACGRDYSLVYWKTLGETNAPITYETKKGVVVTNYPLPASDSRWSGYYKLNKKFFYTLEGNPFSNKLARVYSTGATFTPVGEFTAGDVYDMGSDGGNFFTISHVTDGSLVQVFTKDFSKSLMLDSQPGEVAYVGKCTFSATDAGTTSTTIRVFGKKGIVSQRVFDKP